MVDSKTIEASSDTTRHRRADRLVRLAEMSIGRLRLSRRPRGTQREASEDETQAEGGLKGALGFGQAPIRNCVRMRLAFAGCGFDSGTRQVTGRGGGVVPISPKAFQLLEALILARPKAVSKEDLHALLWPKTFVEDANLPNLVAELRAQLVDSSKNPQIIRTVQRFGYAFVAAEEQPAHEARETPVLGENRGSAAGPAPVVDATPRTSKSPRRAVSVGAILVALAVAAALLSSRKFSFLSRGT